MSNANVFVPITKVDEEKRLVYGRIAHEVVDHADEVFDYNSSKANFQRWSSQIMADSGGKSLGNVRGMHSNIAAGKLTDMRFTDAEKAIDVTAKVVDNNEWDKVLEGVYTGFSMGGTYQRKWPDVMSGKNVTRYTADPSEVSLVDRPCIPTAKFFDIQKKDGTVVPKMFKSAATEVAMLAGAVHEVVKEFLQPTSATSGINAYDQEGAKKPKKTKMDEPTDEDVHKAVVTILEKRGARNSASDLAMLQSVHDTVCKLGAACSSMQKDEVSGQVDKANEVTNMADEEVKKDAIQSEGSKRGATVTNGTAGAGPESSNAAQGEPPAGGHGADRGINGKKKKSDDEDDDMSDDDKKEAAKMWKAAKAKEAEDAQTAQESRIAKSVTDNVLAALTAAGVLTKAVETGVTKATDNDGKKPALFAVGKDGTAAKADGLGEGETKLTKVAASTLPGEKTSDDTNAATLIKAAYAKPMTHDQLFGRR